jgi:hypothetical protein
MARILNVHRPMNFYRERALPGSAAILEALEVFGALCLRCLAKQSNVRFGEVLDALEAIHAPVAQRPCALCVEDWAVYTTRGIVSEQRRAA